MAPKAKKGRGKAINLNDFNDAYIPDDVYDWADSEQLSAEQVAQAKLEEKIEKQRREYSRTANNALMEEENFRTAQMVQPDRRVTCDDLQAPFVAHFGNLRNGTTEEDFLQLFNTTTVVTHRLISQDGKTFAFVEFNSAQAITVALVLDGTMQRGRKMYVDLATPKQVERLLNNGAGAKGGAGGGFSRDQAGQTAPGGGGLAGMDLSRDVFGGHQPEGEAFGAGMRHGGGSRSNFGSRVELGDLSRDLLGSAMQGSPEDASSPVQAPVDFTNWRSEGLVEQPDFRQLRENRSDDRLDFRGARRGGEKSPNAAGAGGGAPAFVNWRDEPAMEVPKREEVGSPRGRGGRGGGGRGGGRDGEKSKTPVVAPPAEDDRWGDFRR